MKDLVECCVCSCYVTPEQAKARRWGSILSLLGKREPCCNRACASILFAKGYVDKYYRDAEEAAEGAAS